MLNTYEGRATTRPKISVYSGLDPLVVVFEVRKVSENARRPDDKLALVQGSFTRKEDLHPIPAPKADSLSAMIPHQ